MPGEPTVIVPVHDALAAATDCLRSVARHTAGARVLVIDDGSADPAARATLQALAREHSFELIERRENLGFARTVNEGLACSSGDVVLLNSDTRVTAGWMEGLREAAAHRPRVASVTPFSNAGSICSLLEHCVDRPLPPGLDEHDLQRLLAGISPRARPALPTGIGFCLLLRREALEAVGGFDAEAFPEGYGEENDWCQRASARGFTHHLADDVFVYHQGAASFGARRAALVEAAAARMRARWPRYFDDLAAWIEACSLAPWLGTFARTLRREEARRRAGRAERAPRVLHVLHASPLGSRVAGAEFHVQQIAAIPALARGYEHAALWADDAGLGAVAGLPDADPEPLLFPCARGDAAAWERAWSALRPDLVHVHNSNHWPQAFLGWAAARAPTIATVHDYYWACPRFTLLDARTREHCGVPTDAAECAACLGHAGERDTSIGAWRSGWLPALHDLAALVAPSRAAIDTLVKAFPSLAGRIECVPNPLFPPPLLFSARPPGRGGPVRALLLGNRDVHKGTHKLLPLAAAVPHLRIEVLGMDALPHAPPNLRFHGRYDHEAVYQRIAALECDFALFLSQCPETFSYTLTEALTCGLPALVPDLGALGERVSALGAGWLYRAASFEDLVARTREVAADPRERTYRARLALAQRPAPNGEEFAARLDAVYQRALGARPARSSVQS